MWNYGKHLSLVFIFHQCTIPLIDCSSRIVNADGDTIIGEKGTDITMKWKVYGMKQLNPIYFYKTSVSINNLIGSISIGKFADESKNVNLESESNLSSGQCTFGSENGTCEVTISNLNYTDGGSYYITAISNEQNVTLVVKGVPEKCGDEVLPQNYTCSPNEEISGNVTICGKPKPAVTWKIGDVNVEDTIQESTAVQHRYRYGFRLKTTPDICGKKVTYRAVGHDNKEVSGSTLILLNKSPPKDGESSALSTGAIVGIVLGIVALIAIIATIVYYLKQNQSNKTGSARKETHMNEKSPVV